MIREVVQEAEVRQADQRQEMLSKLTVIDKLDHDMAEFTVREYCGDEIVLEVAVPLSVRESHRRPLNALARQLREIALELER